MTPNDSKGIEAAPCSRHTEPKPIDEIVREVQSMNICTSLALAHTVLKAVNEHHQANHAMRAAINAYCQAEGVVCVPRELNTKHTLKIQKALHDIEEHRGKHCRENVQVFREFYRAMVAQLEGGREDG